MSEEINDKKYRQEKLKEVIKELHAGKTVDEVKDKFQKVIEGVSPKEIGEMEVQLVKEGLPIEEIQNLCDVHAAVFKGSLEEIHHPDQVPGHPVYTLKKENEALESYIENQLKKNIDNFKLEDSEENIIKLREDLNFIWDIDKHYSRKENLVFPFLEKHGVTAPPQVMWGVDDEIREMIKGVIEKLRSYTGNKEVIVEDIENATHHIKEMIFKEDSILFPMCLETLTQEEWIEIYKESDEVGYAFVSPEKTWEYKRIGDKEKEEEMDYDELKGTIKFENGSLNAEELRSIFEVIPGEVSFVDKDDKVKFFSKGEHRIFTRTKTVIGREVSNCHPPGSVHMVEKILEDFKAGIKDNEDFWIQMGETFVLIRFFAVRNEEGEYLGTLEYVQNVAPIRELKGEKRLMEE